MESNYTVTKGTVELYRIRTKSSGWADITIDANGSKGRISIASDYGRWSNYWGACGDSFKEFLCKINMEYAADKFGADNHFDADSIIDRQKKEVISERRKRRIPSDQARNLISELNDLSNFDYRTSEAFGHDWYGRSMLTEFFDTLGSIHEVTPSFKRFWKDIWPILLAEFEKEKIDSTTSKTEGE